MAKIHDKHIKLTMVQSA
uniref:Uncharacterized protein n=1 Tax=Rhizophora mucronata TaxID=61149 RepID=A0A2P2NQ82_RHIMU